MSTVIILTSTVTVLPHKSFVYQARPDDRIHTYCRSVRAWLSQTSFPVVLVENSGYTFPELEVEQRDYPGRLEIVSYRESELPDASYLTSSDSKGESEMFAIRYAMARASLCQHAPFFIKITARYFVPGLEPYLNALDLSTYEGLHQHEPGRCEMVGCRRDQIDHVFNLHRGMRADRHTHVESVYQERMRQLQRVVRCPPFDIEPTCQGGVDHVYTTI